MAREKLLRVRLSDDEYERLKQHATDTDRLISEVIRDYIKRLPKKSSRNGESDLPLFFSRNHESG